MPVRFVSAADVCGQPRLHVVAKLLVSVERGRLRPMPQELPVADADIELALTSSSGQRIRLAGTSPAEVDGDLVHLRPGDRTRKPQLMPHVGVRVSMTSRTAAKLDLALTLRAGRALQERIELLYWGLAAVRPGEIASARAECLPRRVEIALASTDEVDVRRLREGVNAPFHLIEAGSAASAYTVQSWQTRSSLPAPSIEDDSATLEMRPLSLEPPAAPQNTAEEAKVVEPLGDLKPDEPQDLRALVEARVRAGESLDQLDLRRATLRGANLAGANLSTRDLNCADLTGANLTGADLARATLTGAKLDDATLEGADLSGAVLTGTRLVRANLQNARLSKANVRDANLDGCRCASASFEGADLTNASAREIEGPQSTWDRAKLDGASLRGARLDGSSFVRASFASADLSGAALARAKLQLAELGAASLEGAQLTGADLRQAHCHGARLCKASLRGAMASGLRADGANLEEADLGKAVLREASLIGANLRGARLDGADLRDANLCKADVSGSSRRGCKLAGTKLEGVVERDEPSQKG